MSPKAHKALICPLAWGLGHTTRVMPIIKKLMDENFEILIAGDKQQKAFYSKELPGIEFIFFPSFRVRYARHKFLVLHLFLQLPYFFYSILREHLQLKRLISEHKINIVISDNRYGLFNKRIPTVFITHQVSPKLPGFFSYFEPSIYRLQKLFISRFTFCWIADVDKQNSIAGELASKFPVPINSCFVGILSRFFDFETSQNEVPEYEILGLISGPEPQRTKFEEIIIEKLSRLNKRTLLLQGKPDSERQKFTKENITILPHLGTNDLLHCIYCTPLIIARSGYSTIMDLVQLNKSAVLVPTPGQTEQEYLAEYHQNLGNFILLDQNNIVDFEIEKVKLPKINMDYKMKSRELLHNAVMRLKNRAGLQ